VLHLKASPLWQFPHADLVSSWFLSSHVQFAHGFFLTNAFVFGSGVFTIISVCVRNSFWLFTRGSVRFFINALSVSLSFAFSSMRASEILLGSISLVCPVPSDTMPPKSQCVRTRLAL